MIDLTNRKVGNLTVLKQSVTRLRNILSWDCICDCGNLKTATGVELRRQETTSCGCLHYKGTPKDITGQRSGKLQAVSSTQRKCPNGDYIWNFQCDCGNLTETTIGRFNSKHTTSCGCARIEAAFNSRKYGQVSSASKIYHTWCGIKNRCFNTKAPEYELYGARGIILVKEFCDDFNMFFQEIGNPQEESRAWSVDRIDHTKGYVKGNMRWATDTQQARNKGMNKNNSSGETGVNFYHDGKSEHSTYAMAQWKDLAGKPKNKKFSVSRLGLAPAFAEAIAYRREQIEKLNQQGAGYAYNHGHSSNKKGIYE